MQKVEDSPAAPRTGDRTPQRPRGLDVCAVAVVAALVRLVGLGWKPPWYDELYTALGARRPFFEALTQSGSPENPPLAYAIAALFQPLSDSMFILRLPSALAGAAIAVVITLVGGHLFGRRAGLFAGIFAALSAFELRFSEEARMYSMLALDGIVVAIAAHLAVTRSKHRDWVALALALAVGVWLHYIALLWFGCVGARILFDPVARRRRLVPAAVTLVVALALVAPLTGMFLDARSHTMTVTDRGGDPVWLRPAIAWTHFAGYRNVVEDVPLARVVFAAVAALLGGLSLLGLRRAWIANKAATRTILAFSALPALVACTYFAATNPFHLTSRHLSFVFPGVALLAGIGLAAVPRRLATGAVVVLLGANLGVAGVARLTPHPGAAGWERAFETISSDARPGDRFVGMPHYYGALYSRYYGSGAASKIDAAAIDSLRRAGGRLWLLSLEPHGIPERQTDADRRLAATLEDRHERTGEWRFGSVLLRRYDFRSGDEASPDSGEA